MVCSRTLNLLAICIVIRSQHVLDGQDLGTYAIKKVAVGSSHDYLVKVLKEVKLLQGLRHENIVRLLLS